MASTAAELAVANERLLAIRRNLGIEQRPATERPSLPAAALPADLRSAPPKTAVSPSPAAPAPQQETPTDWIQAFRELNGRQQQAAHETAVSAALAAAPAIVQEKHRRLKDAASGGGILPPCPILSADLENLEARLAAGEATAVAAEMEAKAAMLAAAGQEKAATITVFAQMMTAAARIRHELSMRLWLAVRWLAVNRDGRRNVARWNDVLNTFSKAGEFPITSRANLRRQLNQAARRGYFRFSKDGRDIYYLSERKVIAQILSLPHVGGGAVEFSIDELCSGDFVRNRARFFSSLDAGRGADFAAPISRQSRRNETGRTRKTQYKYEEMQETAVRPNYEYVAKYTPLSYWKTKEAERLDGLTAEDTPARVAQLPNGQKIIAKQLPNSFSSTIATAQRGKRFLNRRIKHLRINAQSGRFSAYTAGSFETEIQQKRYYNDGKTAAAAEGGETYLLLASMSAAEAGIYRQC